jgi:D-alanyl-D-alanine carboxypeptidase/Putative peptidoglycan binding domain
MVSQEVLRPLFGLPATGRNQVPVRVFGTTLTFSRQAANQLLRAAMRAYDVDYRVYRIESYNPRSTTAGGSISAHAWPIAVDINPETNPYSKTQLKTDMPAEFIACFKQEGFGWGGNWRSAKDAMHFSIAPNEGGVPRPEPFDPRLQEQVAEKWRALHGGVDAPIDPSVPTRAAGKKAPAFPGFPLSHGLWKQTKQPDDHVRLCQKRLQERGWRVVVDGRFTVDLASVIRAFQREKRLRVDGQVDEDTWRLIWEAPVT